MRLPRSLWLMLLLAGCRQVPTSVLLEVRAGTDLPVIEWVELDIYGEQGVAVQSRRLPAAGPLGKLPSTVVLYPPQAQGELRLRGRGVAASVIEGEGATRVVIKAGAQVSAVLTLEKGRLPDQDGDGVPDVIDSCPALPNPEQKACPAGDAGVDAPGDGPLVDGLPDRRLFDIGDDPDSARGDLRPDLSCDADKDGHLSSICGGSDCDDSKAAVHPAPNEGTAGQPACSDGLDNDCDGKKDSADPDCVSCTSDAQCADSTICTTDTCSGTVCVHAPANEGKVCTDNLCATGTKCASGVCAGKPKTCPVPTNSCKQATCNQTVGCTEVDRPEGSTCTDADPCTTGETCQSTVCVAPAQAARCFVDGACQANGTKPDTCRTCDTDKTKTSWTMLPGYCFIDGQCRAAGPLAGSPCLTCDPAKSTSTWSTTPGCGIVLYALNQAHTGALGGVAGADGLCQAQATAAGLTGTFKAFLSSSTQAVKNLVTGTGAAMPVLNSKGQILYASWAVVFTAVGFAAGATIYAFDGRLVDEATGASPDWSDADVWTGTLPDGTAATDTCGDWTISTAGTGAGGEIDMNHLVNLTEHNACSLYQAVVCIKLP